jgi:DNA-binding transcriptional MerR regulator
MSTLETVIEMQKKGMSEMEISRNLQSLGVSPSEINNALNQAKIKSAIQGQNQNMQSQNQNIQPQNQNMQSQNQNMQSQNQNMQFQPSITQTGQVLDSYPKNNFQESQGYNQNNNFQNQNSQFDSQQNSSNLPAQNQFSSPNENMQPMPSIMDSGQSSQTYPTEALSSEDQYYSENPYGDQSGYYSDDYNYSGGSGYTDTETITEIAQQVVSEKFKEYNQKTGDMAVFKTMIQDKVNIIEQRLKRIEDNFDKLQHAIIQKIGEFGENTNIIRRDLEGLHNTTSKLMNPLIDHYRELEKKKKP